ncbi:sialate O-acetylesterase [Asticcacaulis machinosus]|uniref:Sialate O-acetylesterase n=1 Tax=Asticcacaulis machinosus TaxID=2984211 RepID=A0ABT5HME8_9CAUL|nr:sialate O-acetylesterase [Asticcacaulis machinosus]MDC7677421.1 sialate O-acetylesterase [Asticcacaulis machinosus]
MKFTAIAGTLCAALISVPAGAQTPANRPLLAEMFQDHAVLQRDRAVPIWGQAAPNEAVTVKLGAQTLTATADAQGVWRASYPATAAGGPYTLDVSTVSGNRQIVNDVLFGDVFLCSGQSNMEWNVQGTIGSQGAIATAKDDTIRMMTVSKTQSLAPSDRFMAPVNWQVASPQTVPNWSAVCYYYARDLKRTINVPIGLINASWGGSNIRPWMSEKALREIGGYNDQLDLMTVYAKDRSAGTARWGANFETWWAANGGAGKPWVVTPKTLATWDKVPDISKNWEQWGLSEFAAYNGGLWYAASVKLTAAQAKGAAMLNLGTIDEIDQTWVNGKPAGYTSGAGTSRVYKLAAGALKAGDNTVIINAVDTWGAGGIYGDGPRNLTLADGTTVALTDWRFQRVPKTVPQPPRAPWDATGGLMTLYNAMIAPIGPYGLKGALWYQGESNAGEAETYAGLLGGMMKDWRGQFGPDLPFLIVQLANYGARPTQPVESGWARLQDQQRLAVARDGNAALAVTIDIGDPNDIHPLDKNTVGKRLARGARSVIYKENITPSGPQPQSATRAGDTVTVAFTDIDGGLISYSTDKPISFELCDSNQGPCTYAAAQLSGNSVTLKAPNAVSAQYVRYCWADAPTCTLYDRAGLPAGPFEIAIK